ncbi:hypothetical protein HELRODRAFT_84083, partial [Helobdella robusta]|uniref:Homeobox domain-containing protein n=1 Tax=Helobdella robusta TaxID=6412 RepID=T1G5E5_HELRO
TREMSGPLKQWLYRHRDTPYPSRAEKLELSCQSNMTLTQVSNWFANARFVHSLVNVSYVAECMCLRACVYVSLYNQFKCLLV